MSGVELTEEGLVVSRPPNELDELAGAFSTILDELDIDHVYVSGYVAILAGRSRATEDIDVLIEPVSDARIQSLVSELDTRGFWGPAMPLDRMDEMLHDHIWVAKSSEMVPHLEVKYVDDRFDRASLDHRIQAHIGPWNLPIGPLELQIAYKCWMGSKTDIEDAAHLFALFEDQLNTEELERWVAELGAETTYERIRRA